MSRLPRSPTLRNQGLSGLFARGRRRRGSGAAVASWSFGLGLGLACGLLAGCLVTDEITFDEEPDLPPVIVDAPATKTKIGSIVWLDATQPTMWSFFVKVRDENRAQPLTAHYRIVTEDDETPPFESRPVPTSGTELRDLELVVKSESLRKGECHHLELAVSAAFFEGKQPLLFDFVPPGREGDVAYASWWLWEGPGAMLATESELSRLARTCGAEEDLLAPAIVEAAP